MNSSKRHYSTCCIPHLKPFNGRTNHKGIISVILNCLGVIFIIIISRMSIGFWLLIHAPTFLLYFLTGILVLPHCNQNHSTYCILAGRPLSPQLLGSSLGDRMCFMLSRVAPKIDSRWQTPASVLAKTLLLHGVHCLLQAHCVCCESVLCCTK